jgi:hypothetical protein
MAPSDESAKPSRPERPKHSARTTADKAARDARLAEEMRKNLLKRKAQARAQRERDEAD